jgi:hypothetical protein
METAPETGQRRRRAPRRARLVRAAGLAATLASWPVLGAPDPDRGRLLFEGRAPLVAKVRGHTELLPISAVRCANCHVTIERPVAPSSPRPTQTLGPALTAAHLMQPQSRRGAPPSRYDQRSFCRLLSTGIDPAEVLLSRTMPLYELSEGDCQALWQYLTLAPR